MKGLYNAVTVAGRSVTATLNAAAATLYPLTFEIESGEGKTKSFSPFYRPSWTKTDVPEGPDLLRYIKGEWPCVPFGTNYPVEVLPPEWRPMTADIEADFADETILPHGYGANAVWDLSQTGLTASAVIKYPDAGPIERIRRSITPHAFLPEVEIALEIEARRRHRTPIGFHPTFHSGPDVPLQIIPSAFEVGMVHPTVVEKDVSKLEPSSLFASLSSVLTKDGKAIDLSHHPLSLVTEEIVMLLGLRDGIDIVYPDRSVRLRLRWNHTKLPHALIWISNGGRSAPPWNSRNICLGIEPIIAAYDLGPFVSAWENPLARIGYPTAAELSPITPWQTHMTISVEREEDEKTSQHYLYPD